MDSRVALLGIIIACTIAFVVGMLYSGGSPNQLIVNVTTVPDTTAQAVVQEQVDEISTYSSGAMATKVAEIIEDELYVADATRQVEFQTAIANGEHGIYQRIKMQLQAEGMTFVETPTPIQTIISRSSGK